MFPNYDVKYNYFLSVLLELLFNNLKIFYYNVDSIVTANKNKESMKLIF